MTLRKATVSTAVAVCVLVAVSILPSASPTRLVGDAAAQDTAIPEDCNGAVRADLDHQPIVSDTARLQPVVMIHGITGSAEEWTQPIVKRVNHLVDPLDRSLVEQINGIDGAVSYTFDYHDNSLRWVTHPAVGEAFGSAIDCLYARFDKPVVVVAHSMGGLATRWVANSVGPLGPRSEQIGLVVTLGTPYEGSDTLAIAQDILNGVSVGPALAGNVTVPLIRLLLHTCGTISTIDVESCPIPLLNVIDSDAGQALRAGSQQLRALQPWPDNIAVHALAGSIIVHDPESLKKPFGLFYTPFTDTTINIGDIAVSASSATADADTTRNWECDYTLDTVDSAADNIGSIIGLVPLAERSDLLYTGLWDSGCYHSALTTSVEPTNDTIFAIAEFMRAAALCPVGTSLVFGGTANNGAVEVGICESGSGLVYRGTEAGIGSIELSACQTAAGQWLAQNEDFYYVVDSLGTAPSTDVALYDGDGQKVFSYVFDGVDGSTDQIPAYSCSGLDKPAGLGGLEPACRGNRLCVTTNGIEELKFGMSASEALATGVVTDDQFYQFTQAVDGYVCGHLTPVGEAEHPYSYSVAYGEQGVFAIDVMSPTILTPVGRVGDLRTEILDAHGEPDRIGVDYTAWMVYSGGEGGYLIALDDVGRVESIRVTASDDLLVQGEDCV